MCMLCVASRWSRRILTMLPCLIIPSVTLWTLSQLLPPGVRFEVTSPRLACIAVILAILGWHELAMPRLSSWRAKRSARLREKRRTEEREAAKWRKEATRRCRNCFAAYRDQTPAGGRYMCTYCGHVSKRPVLDVPGGAHGTGMAGSVGQFPLTGSSAGLVNGGGIFEGRSSKVWSRSGLPDRSNLMGLRTWMGVRPWTTEGGGWSINGFWFGGPWLGSAGYFGTSGAGWGGTVSPFGIGMFEGDKCSVENSYSGVVLFVLNIFYHALFCVEWICQKLQGTGALGETGISGGHTNCQFRDEDAGPLLGTKSDKAKRKAEEKRQARLEKKQLEAEERKQREEVSRLVEERRRQRDEKLEAEESQREGAAEREREAGQEKEAERRRLEKTRGREKVQAKDKLKDQESEDQKRKKGKENENRIDTESNGRKEDFKAMPVDGVESGKTAKRGIMDTISSKGNESGVKGSAGNAFKSRSLSQSKSAAAFQNNAMSFWGRTFSKSSIPVRNVSKVVMPSVSSPSVTSNMNARTNKKFVEASGAACKRIPWTNICHKGTNQMLDDDSKLLVGVVDGRDHRLDTDGVKDLINGTIVSPPCTVGIPLKPIAPPNIPNSCDNLFFSPSVFPLMELPVDSGYQDQRQQTEIGRKIYREPIMTLSLPSSQNYSGITSLDAREQVPMPCISSITVEGASPASLLPAVCNSLNMDDVVGVDNSDAMSLRRPVFDSLMTSFSMDLGTSLSWNLNSNTLSHMHAPFLAPMQGSHGTENDKLPQILKPWSVPPLSFNDRNDNFTQGTWNLWGPRQVPEVKFREPSELADLLDQGSCISQLLPQSSDWSNLDTEFHPSSLFSAQLKHGSLEQSFGKHSCLIPACGNNSIWLDSSALGSTKCIWEEGDVQYKVPQEFVDCITHSLMEDPVITADGYSYERSAIEAWLQSHDTSPKTGEILPPLPEGNGTGVDKTLRPNHILRGQIIEYREHLARGSGYQDSSWSPASEGGSDPSWSLTSSTTMRPHIRCLYPSSTLESVWSYNMS